MEAFLATCKKFPLTYEALEKEEDPRQNVWNFVLHFKSRRCSGNNDWKVELTTNWGVEMMPFSLSCNPRQKGGSDGCAIDVLHDAV